MPDATRVDDLATRKRLLVAECEAHRRAFGHELVQFQSSISGLARPVRSAVSVSRLLLFAAPLAGFVLGRRQGRSGGWFKMGLVGWQLVRRLQPLWAQFRNWRRNRE